MVFSRLINVVSTCFGFYKEQTGQSLFETDLGTKFLDEYE